MTTDRRREEARLVRIYKYSWVYVTSTRDIQPVVEHRDCDRSNQFLEHVY